MILFTRKTKTLQCVSCPEVFETNQDTRYVQCGFCVMADKPRPADWGQPAEGHRPSRRDHDDANQLELGEVTR